MQERPLQILLKDIRTSCRPWLIVLSVLLLTGFLVLAGIGFFGSKQPDTRTINIAFALLVLADVALYLSLYKTPLDRPPLQLRTLGIALLAAAAAGFWVGGNGLLADITFIIALAMVVAASIYSRTEKRNSNDTEG